MKRSTLAGSATAVILLLAPIALPATATADSNPAPSQEPTRTPMEQYRIDRENFNAAIKARGLQIRAINAAFKSACDKAASDFKSAMSVAKGPDQKSAAVAARKSAIAAAIIARDEAIAALGAEPTPPVEPAKPIKLGKSKSR